MTLCVQNLCFLNHTVWGGCSWQTPQGVPVVLLNSQALLGHFFLYKWWLEPKV